VKLAFPILALMASCSTPVVVPPPVVHSIQWQWEAPSDFVSGETFNLYCDVNGAPAIRMNSLPIAGLTFTTPGTPAEDIYSCYARSVVDGVESANSNIAAVQVP
jgi:hypothetical protein